MNQKVVVISDGRKNMDYESILSFYSFEVLSTLDFDADVSNANLVILDVEEKKAIEAANKVRSDFSSMPIIVISDYDCRNKNDIIGSISGYGKSRIFPWKPGFEEKLMALVQEIFFPQYPSKKNDIAIVLPVYNEESRIEHVKSFLKKLRKFMDAGFLNLSIYFVNDGSEDSTKELVEEMVRREFHETQYVYKTAFISSKSLERNTKKAGTYIEGIRSIDAESLVFVDADDSFEIEDVSRMLNIIEEGYYDMVVGTKDMSAEDRPVIRRAMSFAKRMLTRFLLPKGVYDSQTGLKVMKSSSARYILPHLKEDVGLAIDLDILNIAKRLRLRVLQIPVQCKDREGSHVDIVKDSISFLKSIVKIYKQNKNLDI